MFYIKGHGLEPYSDENMGRGLGQWKQDHEFVRIRFKSKGSYEYEEIDKETGELIYHPVVRGLTILERPKELGGGGKDRKT